MKSIYIILIGIFFSSMGLSQTIDCSEYPNDRYPYSKGKGRVFGGIGLIVGGVPASLLSGYIAGSTNAGCGEDEDGDRRCTNEKRGINIGVAVAAISLGSFIVGGVKLIKSYRPYRRRYKQWKRKCYQRRPKENRADVKFGGFHFNPKDSSLGIGFEF